MPVQAVAGRRLGADERALWARVIASVTPMEGKAPSTPPPELNTKEFSASLERVSRLRSTQTDVDERREKKTANAANTLDGGWDRKITRGRIEPDVTVDLHGHTLGSAWQLLDSSLARAISGGDRVILLITGKPPREDRPGRGAIRSRVKDWLAHSRHAGRIAAVRGAHPRHGGTGAIYIIIRRS